MKKLLPIVTLFALALGNMANAQTMPVAQDIKPATVAETINQTININKSDASQLAAMLKGIGMKKAYAIVEYREQYGDFKSIEELKAVKGIGDKTLERNKHIISL